MDLEISILCSVAKSVRVSKKVGGRVDGGMAYAVKNDVPEVWFQRRIMQPFAT